MQFVNRVKRAWNTDAAKDVLLTKQKGRKLRRNFKKFAREHHFFVEVLMFRE